MPITTIEAWLVARLPAVVAWQTYEDDSLSFRSLKKNVALQSARAHHWHIVAISAAAAHNPLLEYMYEALGQEHKGVPMLALAPEPEDLKKESEPTAILAAPGGASSCLTWIKRSDKVARQTSQLGNPRCLVSKAATATSSSTTGTAPSAVVVRRYGDTRGAARGGNAGPSRLAAQGRGGQRRQGDKLAGKSAGTRVVLVSVGGDMLQLTSK
jgi:hypothetical protein